MAKSVRRKRKANRNEPPRDGLPPVIKVEELAALVMPTRDITPDIKVSLDRWASNLEGTAAQIRALIARMK